MSGPSSSEVIRRHFELFTRSVAHLPLYHRLTEMAAGDAEVTDLLLVAQPGQARPVLLLAAVHDLVLRQPDLPLARWYPSVTPPGELATGDPYPAFRQVCLDHADELREVISTHSTQTNEVNRCVLLAPMIAAAVADVSDRPVALVELGSSAGLLLGIDRYRIEVGDAVAGDPASPVGLGGRLVDGTVPVLTPFPPIVARVGLDLAPVSLDDVDRVRWLEACLWPDQPHRVERFRAAVSVMQAQPPRLVQGDFIGSLPDVVRELPDDTHVVVFHCWALTYVARDRRPDLAAAMDALGSEGRSLSWLSAEAPRVAPGIDAPELPEGHEETQPETVLGLRRWRRGLEVEPLAVGWAHPHGEWLTWLA